MGVLGVLRVRLHVQVQLFFYNRGRGYLGMSNFIFNYTFIFIENLNLCVVAMIFQIKNSDKVCKCNVLFLVSDLLYVCNNNL